MIVRRLCHSNGRQQCGGIDGDSIGERVELENCQYHPKSVISLNLSPTLLQTKCTRNYRSIEIVGSYSRGHGWLHGIGWTPEMVRRERPEYSIGAGLCEWIWRCEYGAYFEVGFSCSMQTIWGLTDITSTTAPCPESHLHCPLRFWFSKTFRCMDFGSHDGKRWQHRPSWGGWTCTKWLKNYKRWWRKANCTDRLMRLFHWAHALLKNFSMFSLKLSKTTEGKKWFLSTNKFASPLRRVASTVLCSQLGPRVFECLLVTVETSPALHSNEK